MANKETNNFKAALNELLSGKPATEETKPPLFREDDDMDELIADAIDEAKDMQISAYDDILLKNIPVLDEDDSDEREDDSVEEADDRDSAQGFVTPSQVSVVAMERAVEQHTVANETVIAHDVVIEGNIKSSSKLRIVGEVTGDVKSTADVVIEGKVGGAIQGSNIYLSECEVNNSITASSEIHISERSVINGDIKAGSVISNGVVNGNVDAQSVSLNSASRTVGDVKCKLIKIGEGAGLKGKLETVD